MHTGGDEVKYECWDYDNASIAWMAARGLTSEETYSDFCAKTAKAVAASGGTARTADGDAGSTRRAVQWNNVYDIDGQVAANAVVEVWDPASDVAAAISSGCVKRRARVAPV